METRELRAVVLDSSRGLQEDVVAAVVSALERDGTLARQGVVLRLGGHSVSLGQQEEDAARLVELVAEGEPTPPTQRDLEEAGSARDLIDACVTTGLLSRISAEILLTPAFLARAEELARVEAAKPEGLTVSRFRELLGTTRKYALPILGSFDDRGITRRDGDVRHLRD
jgi:selenocysteine-specific elongation factor